ncbi:hypothetical protein QYE76_033091 [Lolium multiflorum]|uniref:Uncharacterized protein n=1 Tax=Lolium multiflorum TaxID=4521 RepID=A0AAD8QYG8_LOLMU|nr:hypothetical protein QYE76_033091 [Lolium multiflorum]
MTRSTLSRHPVTSIVDLISGHGDEEGPVLFEFLLVLKGDPRGIQRLPDSFAVYVAGDDRPGTMHLREASSGFYRWIVDVIYDARGKIPQHRLGEVHALPRSEALCARVLLLWRTGT